MESGVIINIKSRTVPATVSYKACYYLLSLDY